LAVVAIEGGRADEAHELARAAFETYGADNPLLPRLAHDVAYWWITHGHFARAVPVLRSLLPHFAQPSLRVLVYGNLARAAGGLGDREAFRGAWDDAHDLLRESAADESAARVLLDLAHGASSLGLWDRAEAAARQALDIGTRRTEAKIRLSAEAVLDSIRHHRTVEVKRMAQPTSSAADALADDFVRSLSRAGAAA
ncbi:MAG TPA: hypothetical protein VNP72_04735, partial [Longimicrobium sp.]|nr:hypothetical protein [Longimicrobium sp.]